jgi:hypothetical protein
MRRAVLILLTALLLVAQAPSSSARDALANVAVATVTQNGHRDVRVAWAVQRTNGPDVAAINVALATASCRSCRAAAVAFQIVLASRVTGEVRAQNFALAKSEGCTRCETLAIAYQFVVASEGYLKLAPGARAELAHMGNQLRHLVHEQAATTTLEARADLLAAKIRDVLAQELTTRHIPGHILMKRHVFS